MIKKALAVCFVMVAMQFVMAYTFKWEFSTESGQDVREYKLSRDEAAKAIVAGLSKDHYSIPSDQENYNLSIKWDADNVTVTFYKNGIEKVK